jgi:thiaminase/transcriptional activator TenA
MRFVKFLVVFSWTSFLAHASPAIENRFSQKAWSSIEQTYARIVQHPFNQKLASGSLPIATFNRYSQQDKVYLEEFARALNRLADEVQTPSDVAKLRALAAETIGDEQSMHDQNLQGSAATEILPSTKSYKHFIVWAMDRPKEELAAALLPCFWIYAKLAADLGTHVTDSNRYSSWFKMYRSEDYRMSVDFMIGLTDRLAHQAPPEVREKMMQYFALASTLELWFWDGVYQSSH